MQKETSVKINDGSGEDNENNRNNQNESANSIGSLYLKDMGYLYLLTLLVFGLQTIYSYRAVTAGDERPFQRSILFISAVISLISAIAAAERGVHNVSRMGLFSRSNRDDQDDNDKDGSLEMSEIVKHNPAPGSGQ